MAAATFENCGCNTRAVVFLKFYFALNCSQTPMESFPESRNGPTLNYLGAAAAERGAGLHRINSKIKRPTPEIASWPK